MSAVNYQAFCALQFWLERGEPWSYHECLGPLIDGTNPCEECQGITVSLIELCVHFRDAENLDALTAQLKAWRGE